ncbi:hypothetical protein HMPREF0080_01956 [Anaeroglobus geminatus F0357]|uniref:Uncharacterized protein n=1 Tax=Anaeroglobus geminatus F0357 TaxID=861450 RepID=G9YJV0_9FIRM|nr:hypothetical protein HMPREF0080_01956 [Anaeroglobus geminatus F0357]
MYMYRLSITGFYRQKSNNFPESFHYNFKDPHLKGGSRSLHGNIRAVYRNFKDGDSIKS